MSLTVQQEMALRNLADNLKSANESIERMRSRAASVFAASAGLMSLSSAGEMIGNGSAIQSSLIGLSALGVMAVSIVGVKLYSPSLKTIPGENSDPDDVRDSYIDVSEEEAVNQIISDRTSCFVDAKDQNSKTAKSLKLMVWGFLAQTICVCAAIASKVFA